MRLLNIKRSDYWDTTIGKVVTVYSNVTKGQLEDLTHDLRELGYNIVTFGNKMREFENDTNFVIVERR